VGTSSIDSDRLANVTAVAHRYVDEGRLPNTVISVTHGGDEVLRDAYGFADVTEASPVAEDSIFRIYSMTKPIVSLALMQLYEQGLVLLENRVGRFIPELAELSVWDGSPPTGDGVEGLTTVPADRPMSIHDVLRHTSGLTAGFQLANPVATLYRDRGLGDLRRPKIDLAEAMARLGELPLVGQPGASWHYGMSTDVVGRLVEVISGQPLDKYLADHVFGPLGMVDTGFMVPEEELHRLTTNYLRTPEERMLAVDRPKAERHAVRPPYLSGAGGLVSTLDDYLRFTGMLRGGGQLEGQRLIGRKTLEFMSRNHLPGGASLNDFGQDTFAEVAMEGMGFGLGFSIVLDPAANGAIGSAGTISWGGAASTIFWVDPTEDLEVVFLTQLVPSNTYPIRRQLQAAVYGALA
jgi:CubicO group peptidase (beta-lactamase class C family)